MENSPRPPDQAGSEVSLKGALGGAPRPPSLLCPSPVPSPSHTDTLLSVKARPALVIWSNWSSQLLPTALWFPQHDDCPRTGRRSAPGDVLSPPSSVPNARAGNVNSSSLKHCNGFLSQFKFAGPDRRRLPT